ncbi:MAG: hypothetical protein VX757_11225, partial [Planctomycetota bacterium]|nr:hypothetical protein [Planctomycetota bacterium]
KPKKNVPPFEVASHTPFLNPFPGEGDSSGSSREAVSSSYPGNRMMVEDEKRIDSLMETSTDGL